MSRDLPAERVRKWYRLAQEQLDAAAEQVSLMEIRHHGAIADAGVSVAVSLAAQGAENLKTAAQSLQREAAQAQVEADANGDANATQAAEQAREIAMEAQEAADQLRLRASNLQTRVADALLGQEAANEIDRMTRASNAASSLWSAAK